MQAANFGSPVWSFFSNPECFEKYEKFLELWINFTQNYEPMSYSGKQLVTTHLDIWEDNILMPKDTPYQWVVDFDQTSVGHAVNDIAQIFMSQVFGIDRHESRQKFVQAYLQELNYDSSNESVEL